MDLLCSGRWFAGLPPALQDRLLAAGVVRGVSSGATLFSRGDPLDGLYAVLDGNVRVAGLSESGKEAVLAVLEPPQWFGEVAVFDRLPRTHDALAVTEATVLFIPVAALDRLLAEQPAWWRELGLLVTSKLRLMFLVVEDMALLPLSQRVARRLALMAEGNGEHAEHPKRVLQLRQEVLAGMVSATRQTVNGVLKDLESRGLVRVAYGEIEILDLEGLHAVCRGP
jgi:CRP/FNR family cyclic AMP-dependent transcriptional regulator